VNFQSEMKKNLEHKKVQKTALLGNDTKIIVYPTFNSFPWHLSHLFVITVIIFNGQLVIQFSYLRTFSHLPFRDNTTNSFASSFLFLLTYTNMRGKGNRNISTLTINKLAERRRCGLSPRLKPKIAKCLQVYSLLVAINISCNESEMVMAELRLCMSSPGNNFL